MIRALSVLFYSSILLSSFPATAKSVSGPGDLGPADFWIYLNDSGGFNTLGKAPSPVSDTIVDPVINGVQTTGSLFFDASVGPTGATTTINATIQHSGTAITESTYQLASLITLDVAAFGPVSATPTPVRILGEGLGGSEGLQGSGPGSSFSSASGFVTLYDTDTNGNTGSIVDFWEIPDNFSTTPVDVTVSLIPNELYRVIVRSFASFSFNASTDVDQFAYMFVDPTFTSLNSNYTTFTSPEVNPIPVPAALPMLGSAVAVLALMRRRTSS